MVFVSNWIAVMPSSVPVILNGNEVKGNLTVRDKTFEETFTVESINITDDSVIMMGTLVFDRQKYDVSWEHFVKDYVLSDDITLKINLVATK